MKPKKNGEQGVSRRDFFKVASAAGFGTAVGTYLYGVPGYDFNTEPGDSSHSLGVLFRIKDADISDAGSFSEAEMILEPGSETFVMYNDESEVTYEGISGEAIVLTDEAALDKGMPQARRSTKRTVKKGRAYQVLNPSKSRAKIVQKFHPIWRSDKSYIKVGNQKIRSSELWFELRESFDRQETGVKYKLVKQSKGKGKVESLVRVEPGVKSTVEYHLEGSHLFKVTQGKGIIIIDGKERELGPNEKVKIEHGTKYQLYNPHGARWELSLTAKPGWLPDNSRYIVGNKELKGSDIWFGMRI
jgi:mannose-6-phosphate isomerase-like protein (cupin superfamily)